MTVPSGSSSRWLYVRGGGPLTGGVLAQRGVDPPVQGLRLHPPGGGAECPRRTVRPCTPRPAQDTAPPVPPASPLRPPSPRSAPSPARTTPAATRPPPPHRSPRAPRTRRYN